MKWKELIGGVVGAFAGVWISSKLGLLIPLMCLLIVLMLWFTSCQKGSIRVPR